MFPLWAKEKGKVIMCVFNYTWRRKWQATPGFLLGNPVDRGAWRATVHGVTKESDTTEQLNNKNPYKLTAPVTQAW